MDVFEKRQGKFVTLGGGGHGLGGKLLVFEGKGRGRANFLSKRENKENGC